MPAYQVYRLKEALRAPFRSAPHTSGVTTLKPKDYEKTDVMDAPTPYAAWLARRESESALLVGDALETAEGALWVYKYIGFEEARWYVPEPSAPAPAAPVAVP
ncbi:MAG TPA: hypothetical protein VKT49_00145 [Bryobacteraceae bacterium]|nr:hypothetical protein [Bryobacteraceae bacterium]